MRTHPAHRSRARSAGLAALSLAVVLLAAACGSGARTSLPPTTTRSAATRPAATHRVYFPRAGVVLRTQLGVYAAPSRSSRAVAVLRQFRPDERPTVVFATSETADGSWYRIELPGRSNVRHGWIASAGVQTHLVHTRILIDIRARTLKLFTRGRLRYETRTAVGRPGMATPSGSFYVRAAYHATEPALGAYAFETSAYSKLSDWPGGGIIGIHGTPEPQLLGRAVSHGCVRVSNSAVVALERLVPVGTAVSIVG